MTDSIRTTASNFSLDIQRWREFYIGKNLKHRKLVAGYLAYVEQMAAKRLPPVFEGEHLAELVGVPLELFARITSDTSASYRSFRLAKRSGGHRTIEVPSPTLLHCQRWVDWFILRKLDVHTSAHGYVPTRSNVTNAACHRLSPVILSVDVQDFFGSIREATVTRTFYEAGYPPNVSFLLSQLCCCEGSIPQGSAASPQLSNIIMRRFDERMSNYADQRSLIYTRYVDDITLSGSSISDADYDYVEGTLKSFSLTLNKSKTRLQSTKKRIVTGVSVSHGELRLPREMRRRFKNQAFLLLKQGANVDSTEIENKDPVYIERQLGQIAYWRSIEPDNEVVKRLFGELLNLTRRDD